MGRVLHLKKPKTFSEKIQWLKLYNRRPEYTQMVDKCAVKKYVAERIGEEYVIPLLGVWEKPEDINWDSLPNQFVLKTTNGGGSNGVIICRDKSTFNRNEAIFKLKKALKSNIYGLWREWPYKNVKPRIIAEKYLEDEQIHELRDYKFFCFGGKVRLFKIDFDRFTEHHANYYDINLNLLPFGEADFPPKPEKSLDFPSQINKMLQLAEKLSNDIPFLRVDFYQVNNKVYFGELTFFPASGMGSFHPEKYDEIMGDMLVLPDESVEN